MRANTNFVTGDYICYKNRQGVKPWGRTTVVGCLIVHTQCKYRAIAIKNINKGESMKGKIYIL